MKQKNKKHSGSLAVTLAASLALLMSPALSRPSAAGGAGSQGAQAPIQGAPVPIQSGWEPTQRADPFSSSPLEVMLDGLDRLDPRDIALAGSFDYPIVLWRDQPMIFVDVRDVLDDDQINALLDAIDNDPIAFDNADGLTGFLQQEAVLPPYVDVVGLDLFNDPPTIFVLPE